jgi:hypothetical protein
MLRRPLLALAVALATGLLVQGGRAEAQIFGNTGNFDPFSIYFGYYLPHQAYIAAQPTPLDTINQITAARQFSAVTDRAGLYDPISPYGTGTEEGDPLRPFARGGERLARNVSAGGTSNAQGTGPALYYSRTARYYPTLRIGRGSNRNLGAVRSSQAGGGGFGGAPTSPGYSR